MRLRTKAAVRNDKGGLAKRGKIIAAAAAAGVATVAVPAVCTFGDPLLTLDLRVHDTGSKTATVSNVGDIVTMDLYAFVHDGDGLSNDDLHEVVGSYLSSFGGLKGSLLGSNPNPSFSLYQAPAQNDLDGDGDLDLGGTDPNNATGWAFFIGGAASYFPVPSTGLYIGQVQFTALDLTGGSTSVNWQYRVRTGNIGTQMDLFHSDGVTYSLNGNSSLLGVGAPVTINFDPSGGGPGTTRTFDVWDINAAETNTGTVTANQIRVGVAAAGSYSQSAGFTSAGSVTVGAATGMTGSWSQTGGNIQAGTVVIGGAANGTATHSAGIATFSSLQLGTSGGGAGSYTVSGTAQLNVTGTATVGSGALGSFVQTGGNASIPGTMNVGATGIANLTGGSLSAGRLAVSAGGSMVQDGASVGIGSLALPTVGGSTPAYELKSGQLTANAVTLGGTLRQSGGTSSLGSVFADSASGSRFELAGGVAGALFIRLGAKSTGSTNAYVEQTGGTLNVNTFDISPHGRFDMSGGTFGSDRRLMSAGIVDLASAPVSLNFADGTFVDFAHYWNDPALGTGGTVRYGGGQLLNAGHASITAGKNSFINFPAGFDVATQLGSIASQGIVHVDGQPVTINTGQQLGGTGGVAGDVTNAGVVSPGNSPGQLSIEGNYTQAVGGTLKMEIAGATADLFDLFTVSGTATLTGTLDVSLLNGFVPSPADQFVILTAGVLQGQFTNAPSSIATPQGTFNVSYSPTSVTLSNFSAVPEPATATFAASMLAAGLLRRRRR